MFGANRHNSDASMCSTMPAISGLRRPSESDSGPTISWPSANPARVPVSVSCATDDETDRSSAIFGSAGRYMSMVSGPSATNAPSTTIMRARLGGFDPPAGVEDSAIVTSTSIDAAMRVVSAASQYFVPCITDSERRHDRAPAVRLRSFNKR